MPTTQKTPTSATKLKAHRSARSASEKLVTVPAPVPEFDAAAHHEEIARVAYYKWLERAGSPEEDWLKAESEVRTRYTR